MTLEEARRLPTVISVQRAGELLGVRRARAYELVENGTIPVLRYGRAVRVPTARVLDMLGLKPESGEGDDRPDP